MVKVNCDFAEDFVWWPHSSRLPALNAPFGASILCCSYFWCKDTTLWLRFTNESEKKLYSRKFFPHMWS